VYLIMIARRDEAEVFGAIVGPVEVYVVHFFASAKLAA
jgi:hypothetical protein